MESGNEVMKVLVSKINIIIAILFFLLPISYPPSTPFYIYGLVFFTIVVTNALKQTPILFLSLFTDP